jgi:3-deoxy-D-manno-octulosonic-acid transferase
MALIIYTFCLRILSPLIWGWMAWRARRAGGQWQIFGAERFGAYPQPWDGEAPVWVHAVSLGETRAAHSLIVGLLARGDRVLLTHTTATGRAEGARLFSPEIASGQLRQQWLPYDFPGATRKFFQHFRPRLGILIEREVWPNLIAQAHRARIPMILASARFSEQALGHVRQIDRIFGSLMRNSYAALDLVLAQHNEDATRLYSLGVKNIVVVGNLKFDVVLPVVAVDAGRAWRARLARPIISIASTREGEDAMFVQALSTQNAVDQVNALHGGSLYAGSQHEDVRQLDPQPVASPLVGTPLFLLIPRHPQRFDEAAALLEQAGIRFVRWSVIRHDVHANTELLQAQVVLCDTLGEMPFFYAASDVAIVAGSFAPLGGQNLIEACAVGTPVIVGPHTRNFAEAVQGAVQAGAAIQLAESESIDPALRAVVTAISWLQDEDGIAVRSRAASSWVAQHTGATARMLSEISEFEIARAAPERRRH